MYHQSIAAEYGYHSICKCPAGNDDLTTNSYLQLHLQLAGLSIM